VIGVLIMLRRERIIQFNIIKINNNKITKINKIKTKKTYHLIRFHMRSLFKRPDSIVNLKKQLKK
jgi:hypothetical protein